VQWCGGVKELCDCKVFVRPNKFLEEGNPAACAVNAAVHCLNVSFIILLLLVDFGVWLSSALFRIVSSENRELL